MAYTDIDKVKAMLKGIEIDANTTPALADVNQFIVEEEAEINGVLSEMYVIDITGAKSVAILSKIATLKVSQRVKDIVQVQGEGDGKDRDAFSSWSAMANKMLNNLLPTSKISGSKTLILKPKMYLPDAPLNKGIQGRDNSVTKSAPTPTAATKATFELGKDNW